MSSGMGRSATPLGAQRRVGSDFLGADRRSGERIRVAFQVLRAMPPIEGVAYLRDVSATGTRLAGTAARPKLGLGVRLLVRLPDRPQPVELEGSVVRHADDGFAVSFSKPALELAGLFSAEPLAARAQEAAPAPAARRAAAAPFQEIAVEASIAGAQWISGRLCLPMRRTLLDSLNQGEPFVRAVDVTTPHAPEPQPFVALRADALDLIVPLEGQDGIDPPQRVGSFVGREVRALLPYAVVEGTLEVRDKIRVSDHLMRCGSFLMLEHARVQLARGQRGPRDLSSLPTLIVNTHRVLGISDLAVSPPPPDPDDTADL